MFRKILAENSVQPWMDSIGGWHGSFPSCTAFCRAGEATAVCSLLPFSLL